MWVYIDTSVAGECRFGTVAATNIDVKEVKTRSNGLLPLLSRAVSRKAFSRIKGVCVVAGPGSFSSIRDGVVTANLLARLFRKPLVGVTVDDAKDLTTLASRLEKGKLDPVSFVAPIYDAEPNITRP